MYHPIKETELSQVHYKPRKTSLVKQVFNEQKLNPLKSNSLLTIKKKHLKLRQEWQKWEKKITKINMQTITGLLVRRITHLLKKLKKVKENNGEVLKIFKNKQETSLENL